jgi:uncharacterized protein YoxC
MKKIVLLALCTLLLGSCIEDSAKYRKLKSENENLVEEQKNTAKLLDELLTTLNDIQADIQAIRDTENSLAISPDGAELSASTREQLKKNVKQIAETLKSNRKQLQELQQLLDKSSIKSDALQRTVNRIQQELNQKAAMITTLQNELAGKNIRIEELDQTVAALAQNVEVLAKTTSEQSEKITEQSRKLHTAYFCVGTTKELKQNKILTGGGIFSKAKVLDGFFNEEYFVKLDTREVRAIALYSEKAKIRTTHPEDSYKFSVDDSGNLVINILDVEQFWHWSQYLVVEIK